MARTSALITVSALVLGGLFLILRPDPPSASPTTRSLDLEIRDDGMSPEEISVREGDRVIMSIDSEREVEPGEATELAFEADLTGRFPIENHETETELGVLVVEPR